MSIDEQRKLAAIMFTDMVGYSALSQRDEKLAQALLEEHREILREIFPRFNGTEIKTIGDAFLVEFGSALEAAQCAIEIQRALAKRNADIPPDRRIEVRIGIHIGDVVHRAGDVYGDGVNIASRIEQLANAGGICVSMDVERQIRNALEARFEKLAPTELKNISVPMELFRIVLPWERPGTPVGKSEIPATAGKPHPKSETLTRRIVTTSIAIVLLLTGLLGYQLWRTRNQAAPSKQSGAAEVPEKSIAVMPFENLSRDPDNAYFADGIQEEILTRISKIADLKVISRTSTQHYKSAPSNLPEIARQLGVAHILEGSVQKSADAVRVNVQLIKAANDSHLWADTFDRKLTDIFSVESEVAKAIADQLRAKLTGQEEQVITAKPTDNVEAYDAYLHGLALTTSADSLTLRRTADFFADAARLDPSFALAWARLSSTQSQIYYLFDHLPSRRDAAKLALDNAVRLKADLDEVVLAVGYYNYWVRREFDSAATAFRQVLSRMPNNAEALLALSLIERRQGKWSECLTHQNVAVQFDPQNAYRLGQLVVTHFALKDFAAAHSIEERVLKIRDDAEPRAGLARQYLAQGDIEQAEAAIRGIAPTPDNSYIFEIQVRLALITHRFADAISLLEAAVAHPQLGSGFRLGEYQYLLAFSQELAGNVAAAREDYESAKVKLDGSRRAEPEDPDPAMYLGFVYAGLGDKAGALREAENAISLMPASADAFQGPVYEEARARIQARVGEADSAISEVRRLLDVSYLGPEQIALTPAMLRLDPAWDPLRNDPRFQKLCEEKPK